jgi:hypothetical protein
MIQRYFTLCTDMFARTTPRPHFIHERCFGEDFAAWLVERLRRRELTPSEPVQKDWGWSVLVPFQGHKFTVSIGIMDESIGKTLSEWRVGVEFEKPLNGIRSWFRAAPSPELAQLALTIQDMLRAEPRMEQITEGKGDS